MYILSDYRLIMTKDRPDLSSERADQSGTALARTSSNSSLQTHPLVREGRFERDCAVEDKQQQYIIDPSSR
jgi:hypothetical protein